MSETISPTFTFVKDGVFYFSRRVPRELARHYLSPRIAYAHPTSFSRAFTRWTGLSPQYFRRNR